MDACSESLVLSQQVEAWRSSPIEDQARLPHKVRKDAVGCRVLGASFSMILQSRLNGVDASADNR